MTDAEEPTADAVEEPKDILFAQFLEDVPPSQYRIITNLTEGKWYTPGAGGKRFAKLSTPELQLHCPNANCNGPRFFRYKEDEEPPRVREKSTLLYLTYRCDNCKHSTKTFSLYVEPDPQHPRTGI